jgi:hypothetical protein
MKNLLLLLFTSLFISFSNNLYSQHNTKTYNCYSTNIYRVLSDNSPKLIKSFTEETIVIINVKSILVNSKTDGKNYTEQFNVTKIKDDDDAFILYTNNLLGEEGDTFMLYKDKNLILRMTFLAEANETIMIAYDFK